MILYTAAGLDPARLWEITPRLAAYELEGAAGRIRRERELAWFAGMLPYLERPVQLADFTGDSATPQGRAERAQRVNAAWDKIDCALGHRRNRDEGCQ